jgi:hypothetical protein
MKYIVITNKGKVYTFFLKSVAELYVIAYNGILIEEKELENA